MRETYVSSHQRERWNQPPCSPKVPYQVCSVSGSWEESLQAQGAEVLQRLLVAGVSWCSDWRRADCAVTQQWRAVVEAAVGQTGSVQQGLKFAAVLLQFLAAAVASLQTVEAVSNHRLLYPSLQNPF